MNKLAAIQFAPSGGFKCQGGSILCNNVTSNTAGTLNQLISTIIGVLSVIAFIWFVIQFFLGAISIITAGGDKAKMAEARAKITSAIIGVVVVIAAVFIISLIGIVLGVNFLDPGGFLNQFSGR
jgi:hypothetical protein